ncbi:MAG: YicC family protein [Deltaproteobacteria bacterium]|nr:YicC family protein [Deltaproteobacteria bacterium]
MIKSMTGYGRSDFQAAAPEGEAKEGFYIEIKSLNHRFLDISSRLPERFFALEHRLRDEIKKRFSRGAVTLILNSDGAQRQELKLNLDVAKTYLDAAETLQEDLDVDGELDAQFFLKLKDIFTAGRKELDAEALWEPLKNGLYAAFEQMDAWRVKEGRALRDDLEKRLCALEGFIAKVEALSPQSLAAYRERLKTEMERILGGRVDEARLLQEAAVFAQRSDFSEETVRIKSHVEMFRNYLKADEPVGKRLDFLCQEFLREANTIASKANDAPITQTVVEIKGELEKIREQVQNVE